MRFNVMIALICLIFSGCANTKTYNIYNAKLNMKADLSKFVLDLDINEENICVVDIYPNPADAITFQYVNQITVPQGTNTAVASGIGTAANILTQVILTEWQNNKIQNQANEKVVPLLKVYDKDRLLKLFKHKTLAEISTQQQFSITDISNPDLKLKTHLNLKIQPDLRFSNDLARFQIKLNVSISDSDLSEPVYSNSFEYWSPLVGSKKAEIDRTELWIANDGRLLSSYVEEGSKEVIEMLIYELSILQSKKEQMPPNYKTQRIFNDRGYYSFRGYTIRTTEDRVWIKDLRGNIRSLHGQLEAPEGKNSKSGA